jgi:hypothetical protein
MEIANPGEMDPAEQQMMMQAEVEKPIFNVTEAIPPDDFDAPYSSLPGNVVLTRVKKNVQQSLPKTMSK